MKTQVVSANPHDAGGPAEVGFAATTLGRRLRAVLNDANAGSSTQALADYLLRNPLRATAWGIEELGDHAGVSTASVSRFARHVGLDGYPALRTAIAESLQSALQPVEKLRASIERGEGGSSAVHESLASAARDVTASATGIHAQQAEAIVAALTAAETVYVMGFGLSSHLAGALALNLQPFCNQVITVVEFGGTEVAAGRMMNIGPRDVLFVISFPRYAIDVVRLTQYARDRRARIVAITDSPASPLAPLADSLLIARSDHPILPSSYVAALAVSEALVAALMLSNKRNVTRAARLTEAIASYLVEPAPRGSARDRRSRK